MTVCAYVSFAPHVCYHNGTPSVLFIKNIFFFNINKLKITLEKNPNTSVQFQNNSERIKIENYKDFLLSSREIPVLIV